MATDSLFRERDLFNLTGNVIIMKKKYPLYHPRYWPIHAGFFVLKCMALLPYSVNYHLGKLIGILLYHMNHSMRRVTEINVRTCLKDVDKKTQDKIIRESFINLGCSFTDAFSLAFMRKDKSFTAMIHSIKGLEHLENALNNNQGVLLLFPHLINIYMVGYLLLKKTRLPFGIMYHSPKNPAIKTLANKKLKQYCDAVFTRKDIKPLIKYLRKPHIVWYAPDLDPGRKQAVFTDFLGVEAATHIATGRIAKATKASVIIIGFSRRKDKSFDIEFSAPIMNFPTNNDIQDASTINAALGEIIKAHPEQYLWQYRRFSTVKEGKQSIYTHNP
jgi:Kdo2-lipid IVA lauroyltransferase/acyltransferase